MKKLYLSVYFIGLAVILLAQPPEIYYGGIGDGFHFAAFSADSTIYSAGPSDGFAANSYQNPSSIFVSSASDGFAFSTYSNTNLLTLGGNSDGFASDLYVNPASIYVSSSSDGFAFGTYSNTNLLTLGGDADGFAFDYFMYYHKWTGLVGTGWLVAGNWAFNIIPDENARVIIPAGVPNFPGINIGTFTIGAASGKFKCRNLLIEPAAQLTTRINAITEIYSKVEIRGLMLVNNHTPNTFRLIGGTIIVTSGGELRN